jgi:hypothetical protein
MKSCVYIAQSTVAKSDARGRRFILYHELPDHAPLPHTNSETCVSFDYLSGYLNCAFNMCRQDTEEFQLYNGIPKTIAFRFARDQPRPLSVGTLDDLLRYSRISPILKAGLVRRPK